MINFTVYGERALVNRHLFDGSEEQGTSGGGFADFIDVNLETPHRGGVFLGRGSGSSTSDRIRDSANTTSPQ
ncbi:MAG TPA: hypothetical protein VFU28_12280 [Vicinamibacterales bacterium]|nr:hypothetical protein [Vicinamibacterales bacterium]